MMIYLIYLRSFPYEMFKDFFHSFCKPMYPVYANLAGPYLLGASNLKKTDQNIEKVFYRFFMFRIQPPSPVPNLSKIKSIFCQIWKFPHIHNKRLPWQHLRTMRIVTMCRMTVKGVRLNSKNLILISCGVTDCIKESFPGIPPLLLPR